MTSSSPSSSFQILKLTSSHLSMTQLILHHSCASNPRESTDTDSTPRLKKGPEIAGTGSQIETRSHVSLSSFSPPHYRNPRNRNLMLLGSQAGDSHIDVAHWSIHTARVIGQEASSWSLCAPASEEFELCSSSNRIHIKDLPIRNTLHVSRISFRNMHIRLTKGTESSQYSIQADS